MCNIVGAAGSRREQPVGGMRLPARSSRRTRWIGAAVLASAMSLCALLRVAPIQAASLTISIRLADGHPLPDAVVTVQPIGRKSNPPAPVRAVMDQMHRMFTPEVMVIPVGSTVSFPNSDSVSHQIYSFSPAKRFQLPLYRGKPYPPLLFDRVGVE